MSDERLAGLAVNLELWWPDRPPLERVAAAADTGFGQAEIWYWPNWDIDRLTKACRRHGVSMSQIGGWDFEPRLSDPEHRSRFRDGIARAVEVALRLGAPRINVNGPVLRPGEDPVSVRAGVGEALAGAIAVVEEAGLTLMVEPMNVRVDHPGYALPTSADVIEVCEAVGSEALGINWDLYHLQVTEGDLTGHFAQGREYVAYVQAADHPGRHEPGTGEIDYRFLFAEVRRLGYTGPIGLECTPRDGERAAIERIAALL